MRSTADSPPVHTRRPRPGWRGVCLLALFAAACAAGPDAAEPADRRAWLKSTFFDDHQLLWLRDPLLVEHKFAKMARDPYRFLRGTVPQYFRDLSEDARLATGVGSAASSRIWLVGDPHPENVGTYRDGAGEWALEFNDFDAARPGPFHFDVRRLALGYATMLSMAFDDEPGERAAEIAELIARAYAEEIARLDDAARREPLVPSADAGRVVADLAERARRRGDANTPLRSYTRLEVGQRVWDSRPAGEGATMGPEDDALLEISPRERQTVVAALASYLAERGRDAGAHVPVAEWPIVRRLGAGVSSLPLLRYYALRPGNPAREDDDILLELKEARDPPTLLGLPFVPSRTFRSNAERIVQSQRALQSDPALDPWLGCSAGLEGYRVRELNGYQEGIDAGDVVEGLRRGALGVEDLHALARTTAVLLARTHARGRVLEGTSSPSAAESDALVALQVALADREEDFARDLRDFVSAYTPRLLSDYAQFLRLLDEEGPDLGFSAIP